MYILLEEPKRERSRSEETARIALGLMLVGAGTTHLTVARGPFKAQVPDWVPQKKDAVVLESGLVEIAIGTALLAVPKQRRLVGCVAAAFFVAIFPGNISQYTKRRDAFGLNTDGKRLARLFFQPLLVGWALWAGGVLGGRRRR